MYCPIYYININESYQTISVCCERRNILCKHKDDSLFSRVKMSCFRAKAHVVFQNDICVYIIKNSIFQHPTETVTSLSECKNEEALCTDTCLTSSKRALLLAIINMLYSLIDNLKSNQEINLVHGPNYICVILKVLTGYAWPSLFK